MKFCLLVLLYLSALTAQAANSYRVYNGGSTTIDEFSVCKLVTNNSPNGKDLFVPTKTSAEWLAFRNNPPTGVTVGYSPACEGNARLWLDATDSTTLFQDSACSTAASADTDPIGCWKDKSSAGQNVTQTTAVERPTLNTSQINSKNVVLFNNTNKPLVNTSFAATSTGLVIYVVANYNNASGSDRCFVEISTGTGNRQFFIYQRYSSNTNYTPTANVDSIFGVNHPSGTAFTTYQDGTSLQAGTSAFGTANGTYGNIVIGDDASGGNQLRAKVGEILVFQGTQTTTVRQTIEGYLACKWGLQSRLPAAHPYKSSCP